MFVGETSRIILLSRYSRWLFRVIFILKIKRVFWLLGGGFSKRHKIVTDISPYKDEQRVSVFYHHELENKT